MRLMEGLRLRVKDLDIPRKVITVREAKGGKDRVVMLPQVLVAPMSAQLDKTHALPLCHARESGHPRVAMLFIGACGSSLSQG
jgi:integrase